MSKTAGAAARFAEQPLLVPSGKIEQPRSRFGIEGFCIVADRGMISAETIAALEQQDCLIPDIRRQNTPGQGGKRRGSFQGWTIP